MFAILLILNWGIKKKGQKNRSIFILKRWVVAPAAHYYLGLKKISRKACLLFSLLVWWQKRWIAFWYSLNLHRGWRLRAIVDYYHKTLHLGCCSSPRSASAALLHIDYYILQVCVGTWGGHRTAATSKMERFVTIINVISRNL